MRIAVTHTTRISYSAHVVEGIMDVRLGPYSDADQRWGHFDLRASPTAAIWRYADGFGNQAHLLTVARPHQRIELVSHGEIETFLADPFVPLAGPAPPLSLAERSDYLGPSPLVEPDAELARLAEPHRPRTPADTFETVRALMDFVYTGFTYQQHVTTVSTKVPEVLAARTGVCQDFAHVLVGLCRSVEIPARYVSGYIVADSQQQAQDAGRQAQWQRQGMGGQSQWQSQDGGGSQSQWQSQSTDAPPTRGTGASHAWIEAYTPTHGWRGFDPTNNLLATTNHVKMAIGRDYSDVPPTRGTFRGAAEESFAVEVLAVRRD